VTKTKTREIFSRGRERGKIEKMNRLLDICVGRKKREIEKKKKYKIK
jgi:hypothetical protein